MKIAILGASGAVGQAMIESLISQNIKVDYLKLLASKNSVGKTVVFKGEKLMIEEAKEDSFIGMDIVLGAVDEKTALYFAPFIKKAQAIFIDNSSAFRLKDDVPLIIPEINHQDIKNHKGIIANPNCSTIITLMALHGINRLSKITHIIASTYQAVSGAGTAGIKELENQIAGSKDAEVFKEQIAYNCLAEIGGVNEDGFTSEEVKMGNEAKKILHNDDLLVTCTCVRVPVIRSHSISLSFKCEKKLCKNEVFSALKNSEGVSYEVLPTPLKASNQELIKVGRLREDKAFDGFALWCCGDQILKGAASNAVSIIKYL